MSYSNPINDLCHELCNQAGKKVTERNYHKVFTLQQYVEFCKEHWDTLQEIHPNLIESYDIDDAIRTWKLGQWDFFSLIIGVPNFRLEK